MTALRITLLGSGSVGLAIAATFARAGAVVTLLARGPAVEQLRAHGITVTGVAGAHAVGPAQVKVSDVAQPDPQDLQCDVLIVATKAYHLQSALGALMEKAGSAFAPGAVLLLQNGWGSADEMRALLPAQIPIFSSIMLIGIERRTPAHIHITVQAGPVRVGSLFAVGAAGMRVAVAHMQSAVARGQSGFLPLVYDDPIEPAILHKFLFNTCLNALSALTRMTYGELVNQAPMRHLITQLADETIRVVRQQRGISLAADGADYVERTLLPLVIPKGAAHHSSMFQDLEAGRRTEIDYLNGAVLRMGASCGIATPYNDAIAALIQVRAGAAD